MSQNMDQLTDRLTAELRTEVPGFDSLPFLEKLEHRLRKVRGAVRDLRTVAASGTASQAREARAAAETGDGYIEALEERIQELREERDREVNAAQNDRDVAAAMRHSTAPHDTRGIYSQLLTRSVKSAEEARAYTDPRGATYGRHNKHEVSFFRDLAASRRGDYGASERLHRNAQERAAEQRAGDMSTSAGAGGQFAAPLWILEDYVALARASRPIANALRHQALPAGVSSVNIPKVSTGTSTAIQGTQNTALSDTAMTTGALSAGVSTVGGKQIVSLQLLQQSGIAFDEVVLGDLAADAARTVDIQVINGSGSSGQLAGLIGAGTTSTFTSASPVVAGTTPANSFQGAVVRAANAVNTTRYLPPTVLAMTPTRWAWITEAVDSQGRPLVVPEDTGSAFNSFGTAAGINSEGFVGRFAGLPVLIDPNIPANLGAGTNQDVALVMRADDVWFYESEPRLESFEATYADQVSVLFRAIHFVVSPLVRYTGSVQVISGTGMISPSL